ncbi:polyamine aminopropyltransferase [Bradyrhizobium sp. BWA-3-5]|uniref:polyamine aminopropyltransferase n=1 Tax=Bradyrhizobium sp. BWA-3-5 TaxID=3080013 RepID=UPI00293EDC9F|nr:polyamine aminopropyltransferase [Bradyrhizobium sp. BWA-3-5]WOH67807.1 polyamine aminopropyltransferase [Bradyrhizobium sp. BWA-3-5]
MREFQENLYEHHSQTFTIDAELYRGQTEFQEVLIFENRLFGRVLVLDGIVQLTQRDNYIYHEMLTHVPLMAHARTKSVLIIGGGDGGALKEILKHPVQQVVMVELDKDVIALSKRYFPEVSSGAFEDGRVSLIVGNGFEYVAQTRRQFDAIIVDSTDPIGSGEALFTRSFYAHCRKLLHPGGVLSLQSGVPFYNPEQLQAVCGRLAFSFEGVRPYLAPVPSYAGGMLALVAAGESHKALRPPIKTLRERFQRLHLRTDYYSPVIHRAAFTLAPRFGSCAKANAIGSESAARPA